MDESSLVRPFRAILVVVAGVFLTVIFQDPISSFLASLGVEPKKFGIWQVAMLTGVLGFAIGVVTAKNLQNSVAIKNHLQNRRLRNLHTFEEDFGLPFLGWTPENDYPDDLGTLLADRDSAFSEGVTSIADAAISQLGPDPQLLMFTSAGPADGKSTLCAGFARTLAARGKRILVIDGDLRRPRQCDFFSFDASLGIADCIADRGPPSDYIVASGVEGIWILPLGSASLRPDHIWHHFAERGLWKQLVKEFDFVLVDTPPVLSLADAPMLARSIRNVIFVVRHGFVEKSRTDMALRRLNLAGGSLKIVMAGMFLPAKRYGYSYTYLYEPRGDEPSPDPTT